MSPPAVVKNSSAVNNFPHINRGKGYGTLIAENVHKTKERITVLRRLLFLFLGLIVTSSPLQAEKDYRKYVQVILKSADCYAEEENEKEEREERKEEQGNKMDILLNEYMQNCRKLDSLKSVFLPIDTLSGWIGLNRVREIADLHTRLGMYEQGLNWWLLLRRTDQKGFFRKETYHGLLTGGVELSDSLLLAGLLNGVEVWEVSTKRELSREIMAAMDLLFFRGVDPDWLWKKFNRLERFFPHPESSFLALRIMFRRQQWSKANELSHQVLNRYGYLKFSPCQLRELLEATFKSAFFSGKTAEAKTILESVIEYGRGEQVRQAKLWLTGIHLVHKEFERGERELELLCSKGVETNVTCFWSNYLKEYKESMSGAEQ